MLIGTNSNWLYVNLVTYVLIMTSCDLLSFIVVCPYSEYLNSNKPINNRHIPATLKIDGNDLSWLHV